MKAGKNTLTLETKQEIWLLLSLIRSMENEMDIVERARMEMNLQGLTRCLESGRAVIGFGSGHEIFKAAEIIMNALYKKYDIAPNMRLADYCSELEMELVKTIATMQLYVYVDCGGDVQQLRKWIRENIENKKGGHMQVVDEILPPETKQELVEAGATEIQLQQARAILKSGKRIAVVRGKNADGSEQLFIMAGGDIGGPPLL